MTALRADPATEPSQTADDPETAISCVIRDVCAEADPARARDHVAAYLRSVVPCTWLTIAEYRRHGDLCFMLGGRDPVLRSVLTIVRATGEGALQSAFVERRPVSSPNLLTEHRWPRYTELMLDHTPIRSAAAVPLVAGEQLVGVMGFYGDGADPPWCRSVPLTATDVDRLALALSVANLRCREANLETALQTNRRIAMAVGVLMGRHNITEELAVQRMREFSQQRHQRMAEIADYVVLAGDLPDEP